jgi:hypothetical protein
MTSQKFFALALLVSIGIAIYLDPRCNSMCKKTIRKIGSGLLG